MSLDPFKDKNIVLGITGSIAAYKAADLASRITQAGGTVTTILTESSSKLISPLTFAALTGRKSYTDADLWSESEHVPHIFLARQADVVIIAPATANMMAKLAHGLADDLLSVTALAYGNGSTQKPLIIAPAMDGGMFTNEATQANIQILQQRGAIIIGPEEGYLASGLKARGRMTEPQDIFTRLRYMLSRNGDLKGKQVIVTAGGTREVIDPVRVISNRSSGKQGYAIAQEALDRGADVILITAPSQLDVPFAATCVPVSTADEMEQAVMQNIAKADALIMAAAVSDFTISDTSKEKIKRKEGKLALKLVATDDILMQVAQVRKKSGKPDVVIGFAAESQDLIANAQKKLAAKDLDMIVANDISSQTSGFEVDKNKVTVLLKNDQKIDLPLMGKDEVAEKLIDQMVELLKKAKKA
ncbi:MAG: bifunctional phosphopantothenoylcysteine decarboxylase/phosphopantothenate--cysteine ligase CoaBC [Anaerolineaceae bacterium]|nr:bifunctional phosphopantothenoylcysteine decarboxylase/phosphopantothenate--cysteine ligase CoaBC [Anaerolineaceae bacterium]MBN2677184.1 bifunctional phosphopantothenoylcysteine decarboxylase/phosphopantothenate--cysteine ligase CoaBC [Anaerolineaceae bacterium]